ncbi:MAG: dual specificity protein phosphatase family protein [Acidobacteriota bacterium]
MNAITVLYALLVIQTASLLANGQDHGGTKDLPNFGSVSPVLYRGGQPTETGIIQLAGRGIKTVVNLRGDDANARKEKLWVQKAGMRYVGIPMADWGKPKIGDLDEVLRLIAQSEGQPIFVHCRRGADRTGTVIAAYRITRDGWTAKKALKEAEEYRMGWWQFPKKKFIKHFYKARLSSKT